MRHGGGHLTRLNLPVFLARSPSTALQMQLLKSSLDQVLGMGPSGQPGPASTPHPRWRQLEQALGVGEHGGPQLGHMDLAPLPSVPAMLSSLVEAARLLGASGAVVDSLLANTARTAYSYVSWRLWQQGTSHAGVSVCVHACMCVCACEWMMMQGYVLAGSPIAGML